MQKKESVNEQEEEMNLKIRLAEERAERSEEHCHAVEKEMESMGITHESVANLLKEDHAGWLAFEDGKAVVDDIDWIDGSDGSEIGIEVHIGKNRIIRRIFEHLGYVVERLDRVYYAGLTKKDLPRGWFRELKPKELIMLKHFTDHS